MQLDADALTARNDGNVAVLVGTPQRHAQAQQVVHQAQGGMAVGVVRTDGDDAQSRMHSGHEGRREVGAAMVRHLQNVRSDRRTAVE